jgi:D-glycero-D-manno-heptose 1,7-bisphosphate phosphatase
MKKKTKIAFLDRDGVLNNKNINGGYIGVIENFKWIKGAKKAIKFLKNNGYKVIIVTNQSGVARGYFTIKDVYKVHRHLKNQLKMIDTFVDQIYFCPYHIDGVVKKYKKKSNLRKPNNGMFKLVEKKLNIDKENSFMVGDQKTDLEFASKSRIRGFLFNKENLYSFVKKIIKQA